MSHSNTPLPSITRELLALPEVNFAGIANTLVVCLLSADVQAQIRAATTTENQIALAAVSATTLRRFKRCITT